MKEFSKATTLIIAIIITTLSFFGCNSDDEKAKQALANTVITDETKNTEPKALPNVKPKVTLEKNSLAIKAGDCAFLKYTVTPDDFTNSISFKSDNEAVAVVDSAGRVDALSIGTANIKAEVNGSYAICKITVTKSKSENKSLFSTAYTANEDILSKNKSGTTYRHLYKIEVNRTKNCVTVYTYDENGEYTVPVRAMICSTGKDKGTVTGDFKIGVKYRWLPLFGDVYGQYVSGFYGNFLFHSVPYLQESPDSLKAEEYNKLGQEASLGCVRLAVSDAKWIYKNCEEGTAVSIFDSEKDGPLGTPPSMHIDTNSTWDPTDDNKSNPYRTKTPQIYGATDKTIKKGEAFYPLDGITAVDTCQNDITDSIKVIGTVLTNKSGKYHLTYKVTDALSRVATKDIYITVE